MGKGKMSGDDSKNSKGHLDRKARGSGGSTKSSRDTTYQDNNKARNTKANSQ